MRCRADLPIGGQRRHCPQLSNFGGGRSRAREIAGRHSLIAARSCLRLPPRRWSALSREPAQWLGFSAGPSRGAGMEALRSIRNCAGRAAITELMMVSRTTSTITIVIFRSLKRNSLRVDAKRRPRGNQRALTRSTCQWHGRDCASRPALPRLVGSRVDARVLQTIGVAPVQGWSRSEGRLRRFARTIPTVSRTCSWRSVASNRNAAVPRNVADDAPSGSASRAAA